MKTPAATLEINADEAIDDLINLMDGLKIVDWKLRQFPLGNVSPFSTFFEKNFNIFFLSLFLSTSFKSVDTPSNL